MNHFDFTDALNVATFILVLATFILEIAIQLK